MGEAMEQLNDITAYLAERYPHKSELSKARLTKLVYLADWQSVKQSGNQLTDIRWYFHNFGPYVDDVVNAARNDPRLSVVKTRNAYGDLKEQIQYVGSGSEGRSLSEHARSCLNTVITETQNLYWNGFIKYVYDTPPVALSSRYTFLNLNNFAESRRPE